MMKILVVDNHPVMLQFMTALLEKEGHQVVAAEDGIVALDKLKSYVPDVVFLDLVMPTITAEKLCRIIRSMPEMKDATLIIISAIASESNVDFIELGANACIAKGSFDRMTENVLDVLRHVQDKTIGHLSSDVMGLEGMHAREITRELLDAKKHSEVILDNMSEGIFELNPDGKIIYLNPEAASLTDHREEELLGLYFYDLFKGVDRREIRKDLSSIDDEPRNIVRETPLALNGKQATMNILPVTSGIKQSTVIIVNDVTEQNRLEAQLQRAQKMEAIGVLAGGVAHDLNNILSGLVSYPELLLLDIEESSPLRKPIQTIQKSGERAAAIVQDLLIMARRGTPITEVVNLNHIILEYLETPEHGKLLSFHPDVQIEADLDPKLLNILGSTAHLTKAMMNLVSNAAEAMPRGGKISVSTQNMYIDKPIKGYDDVNEGDYVVLTVTDRGTGMSPEDMDRIFEPFYTKKVMGRSGTGLGLAVLWGTVKDHGGHIDVRSTEDRGTTFMIYFPVSREEVPKIDPSFSIGDYRGGGKTVLVVDDVPVQREIATSILAKLGYSVDAVASGEEAVSHLHDGSADLIVLDMIMDPGIDGLETYKRILELHPGQKAIITSGFSETDNVKKVQALGAGPYIKKPYTLERIGRAVRDELRKP